MIEKADNLSVVLFAKRWSDLSDWAAVLRETQEDGVSLFGPATAIDCHDTLLRSEAPEQAIVGIGLDDIVAAAMPDAVLISYKGRTQEVKQAVAALKAEAGPQAEAFLKDHHPLGLVRKTGHRRPVSGQADRGAPRCRAVPAKPPPPVGALDRRAGRRWMRM